MKDTNAPFSTGDKLRQQMSREDIKPRARKYKRCYCGIHGGHHHRRLEAAK